MLNIQSLKERITTLLPKEEISSGEVLFRNCDCQILKKK
jgi:hypothetical protein